MVTEKHCALLAMLFLITMLLMERYEPLKIEYNIVLEEKVPKAEDLECLSKNIYHEARGEGLEGMWAVAMVTLNRLRDGRFPKTICGVVYEPFQFSWTSTKVVEREPEALDYSSQVAYAALQLENHELADNTEGSKWFHSIAIKRPVWTKKLKKAVNVGKHIFYRE